MKIETGGLLKTTPSSNTEPENGSNACSGKSCSWLFKGIWNQRSRLGAGESPDYDRRILYLSNLEKAEMPELKKNLRFPLVQTLI